MLSKTRTAQEILKDEGAFTLLSEIIQYLRKDTFLGSVYWSLVESYTLEAQGVTCRFNSINEKESEKNISRFSSEKGEIEDLLTELEPDDVFYDIGANTGIYTCFAAEVLSSGSVISFEPYPPNIYQLINNIELNSFGNVRIVELALSNSAGSVDFSTPKISEIGLGTGAITPSENKGRIIVPSIMGDSLVEENTIPQPNVVKIDVEGAEPLVIKGLTNSLSNPKCRFVLCELHLPTGEARPSVVDFGSSEEEVCDMFESMGYSVEVGERSGNRVLLRARK